MDYSIENKMAEDLAKEIASRNMISIPEIKILLLVRFRAAILDIIKEAGMEPNARYQQLKETFANYQATGDKRQAIIQGELIKAKRNVAYNNRAFQTVQDRELFHAMLHFIKDTHGQETLDRIRNIVIKTQSNS